MGPVGGRLGPWTYQARYHRQRRGVGAVGRSIGADSDRRWTRGAAVVGGVDWELPGDGEKKMSETN